MNKKQQNKYTHLIITVGAIVVVLLGGFLVYQNHLAAQRREGEAFNKSHFNPNVTIYDVAVGKMTKKQAYQAVNKKAKDKAVLTGDKVTTAKVKSEIISQKEINALFNKQRTKYPVNNQINYHNTKLDKAKRKLNEIKNRSVTYTIKDKEYKFERSDYFPKVSYYDDQFHFEDTKKLTDKIESINKKVNTFHESYPFKLPSGKTITVKNESYGWAINTKHLIPALEKAITENKQTVNGKDYIYGLGFSTYGTGYGLPNHGIGHTYIVVSIKQQKAWFYRRGKLALVLNEVVTGTAATNPRTKQSDETPVGVWYIEYKESPSVLRGTNSDGSSYASPVKYWMPFTVSGCGFHDASWRTDWSKTAYLEGGSHGCVNVKPSQIKQVWDVVEQYEPVIIYK